MPRDGKGRFAKEEEQVLENTFKERELNYTKMDGNHNPGTYYTSDNPKAAFRSIDDYVTMAVNFVKNLPWIVIIMFIMYVIWGKMLQHGTEAITNVCNGIYGPKNFTCPNLTCPEVPECKYSAEDFKELLAQIAALNERKY